MSKMTTEQALEYIDKAKEKETASEETKVETAPSVEETKVESKSESKDANTPEDKVDSNDKVETKAETTTDKDKESDESKSKSVEVKQEEPPSKFPELSKRDYAFIREKQKRKDMKAKYEARIKELEDELNKKNGLEPEHFKNQDGSLDAKSYMNWKFKERDMQDEIQRIRKQNEEEQYNYDLERDKYITEHCFSNPQELQDYNKLISEKGKSFAEAVRERDPNGVVFGYLETLNEYPIVLKELMDLDKNPTLLPRVFRSSDPDSLKYNISRVADEILEKYHAPKQVQTPVQPEIKPAIPVIGKQITNQTTSVEPIVKDRNYWNNYLRNHPRG